MTLAIAGIVLATSVHAAEKAKTAEAWKTIKN